MCLSILHRAFLGQVAACAKFACKNERRVARPSKRCQGLSEYEPNMAHPSEKTCAGVSSFSHERAPRGPNSYRFEARTYFRTNSTNSHTPPAPSDLNTNGYFRTSFRK